MVSTLPDYVARSVNELAELHADHHRNASAGQRAIRRVTLFIGRPLLLGLLLAWREHG